MAPTDAHIVPSRLQANALARLQRQLADHLTGLLDAAQTLPDLPLVLAGRLFRNSFFTTALADATPRHVIVPPDPGSGALCVGLLAAVGAASHPPSPFEGPAFDMAATKLVLDNCKLSYEYPTEQETLKRVIAALLRGHLVAWFEGGMEWGPRALGHRSILADARNPYVLENLNVFLKKRPSFMSYGLALTQGREADVLTSPRDSPSMQFESPVRDRSALRHFLRRDGQAVRVQSVPPNGSGLSRVLDGMEATTGVPYLVNTSFNAMTEPIVATPDDAVRCFYGSGLDVMVMNGWYICK